MEGIVTRVALQAGGGWIPERGIVSRNEDGLIDGTFGRVSGLLGLLRGEKGHGGALEEARGPIFCL